MFKKMFFAVIMMGIAGICYAQNGNCAACRTCQNCRTCTNTNNSGYQYVWNGWWYSLAPVTAKEEAKEENTEAGTEEPALKPVEQENVPEEVPLDDVPKACEPCKACAPCQVTELPADSEGQEVPANTSLVKIPSSLGCTDLIPAEVENKEPTLIPSELPNDAVVPNEDGTIEVKVLAVPPFCVRVIELINNFRRARGIPELKMDETLCNNCESHSVYMSRFGFQHAYGAGMECIASGVNTPEALVNMWMNSPAHAGILLSPGCRFIGIGSCNVFHTARVK